MPRPVQLARQKGRGDRHVALHNLTYDDMADVIETLNRRHCVNATVMNKGQLEAALEKPSLSMYGRVFYPELYQKAAVLMESICKSHCLSDGNKRASMMAAEYLVIANGATLVLPLKSIRLTVDCAMDRDDKMSDELIMWFKTHIAQDSIQLAIMLEELIEEQQVVTTLLDQGKYDEAEQVVDDWLVFNNYPESKAAWNVLTDKWKKRNESLEPKPGTPGSNFPPWPSISPELRIDDGVRPAAVLPNARTANPLYTGHNLSELKKVERHIQAQSALSDAPALRRIVHILEQFHSYKNACLVCDKLIKVEGRSDSTMRRKLFNLALSGQYNEALEVSNQLLESNQNSASLNRLKAIVCIIRGDRQSALESANRVLRHVPDDLHMLKIKAYVIREYDPTGAEKMDRDIYLRDPDDLTSIQNMATSLSNQGQDNDAIKLFDKILLSAPHDATAHYNKGLCLSRMGRNEDALACYEKSLQIDPGYVDALINMGAVYTNDGKGDKARDYTTKALELSPRHPVGLLNMGRVLLSLNDVQGCIDVLDTLLSVDPLNARGMYLLAYAYIKHNKTIRSLEILERLVNVDPSYKVRVKNDPDFSQLWYLKRFKDL